jgi:hypothetical protein
MDAFDSLLISCESELSSFPIRPENLTAARSCLSEIHKVLPTLPPGQQAAARDKVHDITTLIRRRAVELEREARVAASSSREALLGSPGELTQRRGPAGTAPTENKNLKSNLVAQSQSALDSLSRARQLMEKEVERTGGTIKVLEGSSETLMGANREFKMIGEGLSQGAAVLGQLETRERTELVLLLFGFLLFILTVIYVIRARI